METGQYLAPISILRLFETDSRQRKSFVSQVIERLEGGFADPLETHIHLKMMEEVVKQVTSNEEYKKYVLDAATKEGKSFAFHNAKMEIAEVGVKYDYSKCGDAILEGLESEIQELTGLKKERETFLKSLPKIGLIVTYESTGETVTLYPPTKTSTTSVKCTLK